MDPPFRKRGLRRVGSELVESFEGGLYGEFELERRVVRLGPPVFVTFFPLDLRAGVSSVVKVV